MTGCSHINTEHTHAPRPEQTSAGLWRCPRGEPHAFCITLEPHQPGGQLSWPCFRWRSQVFEAGARARSQTWGCSLFWPHTWTLPGAQASHQVGHVECLPQWRTWPGLSERSVLDSCALDLGPAVAKPLALSALSSPLSCSLHPSIRRATDDPSREWP